MGTFEDMKSTKFNINGDEYVRVNGIWFKYTGDQYIPIDNPEFEQYYMENFKND
jgi:hypothetical protein